MVGERKEKTYVYKMGSWA